MINHYVCSECGVGQMTHEQAQAHECGVKQPEPVMVEAPKTLDDVVAAIQAVALQMQKLHVSVEGVRHEFMKFNEANEDRWGVVE